MEPGAPRGGDQALHAPRRGHPRPSADRRAVRRAPSRRDRALRRAAVARPGSVPSVRRLRGQCARHAQSPRSSANTLLRSRRSSSCRRTRCTEMHRTSCRSSSSRRVGTTPTPNDYDGIDEDCRIDKTLHSLFGASKVAADVLVQEYGRYFGLPTVCFRGGCLTGPNHSGAELHGFLAYLARAVQRRPAVSHLRLQGQAGPRQHPLVRRVPAIAAFSRVRRRAAVYNLGGGRTNSVSMLEAIDRFESLFGRRVGVGVRRGAASRRPHLLHLGSESLRADFPDWSITRSLDDIFDDFARAAEHRVG